MDPGSALRLSGVTTEWVAGRGRVKPDSPLIAPLAHTLGDAAQGIADFGLLAGEGKGQTLALGAIEWEAARFGFKDFRELANVVQAIVHTGHFLNAAL